MTKQQDESQFRAEHVCSIWFSIRNNLHIQKTGIKFVLAVENNETGG